MSDNVNVSVSRGGCLSTIVAIIFIWALIFGVTIGGKHHGISCTRDRGVVVE